MRCILGRMELLEYINNNLPTRPERECFAKRCGTSFAFIRNVAYGYRRAGAWLCINIERESEGAVKCEDLRPDVDWAYLRGTEPVQQKAACNP